jgi:hypothetical protein
VEDDVGSAVLLFLGLEEMLWHGTDRFG